MSNTLNADGPAGNQNGPDTDDQGTGPTEEVEDNLDTGVDDQGDADDQDPEGAEHLGDPGKKALDATKQKWKTERDLRRKLERQLAEATKADDGEPSVEQIRTDAETAATAKANRRIVRAEVKAAASGKFADPADALAFLDLDSFEVDADGEIDPDEINEAITDLITRKPHLAARAKQRFQGTGDGGSRSGSVPKQITSREELAKMTPADRLKAHQDGRLKNLLQN